MTSTPVEKVFRCTSCQSIYLDEPVSQCCCMGGPTIGAEFTEMRLVSVADFELLVKIKGIAAECGVQNPVISIRACGDVQL